MFALGVMATFLWYMTAPTEHGPKGAHPSASP